MANTKKNRTLGEKKGNRVRADEPAPKRTGERTPERDMSGSHHIETFGPGRKRISSQENPFNAWTRKKNMGKKKEPYHPC